MAMFYFSNCQVITELSSRMLKILRAWGSNNSNIIRKTLDEILSDKRHNKDNGLNLMTNSVLSIESH